MNRKSLFVAIALLLFGATAAAADCVEDTRPAAVGDGIVPMRAYSCQQGDIRLKAEFHRLSAGAVGVLLADAQVGVLAGALGNSELVPNEVLATVDDLLQRFGRPYETQYTSLVLNISAPKGGTGSESQPTTTPTLRVFETDIANVDGFYFPAASEIRALARDRLPNGFKRIDRERIWRFASPTDFLSYDNRLRDFIELYGDDGAYSPDATGGTIDLMKHLAAGGLPDDFTVIYGWYSEGGCATGLGWVFEYLPRIPIVEAMIVENASTRPVSLSALTGSRTEGGLRKPANAAGNPAIITNLDRKLAPGERVLFATSLLFAPSDVLREFTSSTYIYGPALAVTGVIVDRERVDFAGRSANFTELSLLFEEGSCPYLMSWSEVEGEWIDRGKVLHAATGRANQEREVVAYEGLRTRFRLEEREPEVANIDEAFLVLHMNDGRTVEIRALLSSLADLDDVTASFHWSESVEFDFILGPEVDPSAVARSELHLTGHYERYSDMPILAAADGASDVLPPADRAAPLVCPPVRREVKATPFDVF